jgi:DNA-binding response OmpR family regulator
MHALIIEDQPLIAATIEAELRDLGFTSFDIAKSEEEAVTAAARQQPDFVTVDDTLTAGTGTEAVLKICTRQPTAVVVITGKPFEVALPDVVTLGKPFSTAAFRAAWERARARPLFLAAS